MHLCAIFLTTKFLSRRFLLCCTRRRRQVQPLTHLDATRSTVAQASASIVVLNLDHLFASMLSLFFLFRRSPSSGRAGARTRRRRCNRAVCGQYACIIPRAHDGRRRCLFRAHGSVGHASLIAWRRRRVVRMCLLGGAFKIAINSRDIGPCRRICCLYRV